MDLRDMQKALGRRPFQPFRVCVSDGATFDVKHPELCVPGLDSIFIGFPDPVSDELAYDDYEIIDLAHITRLEPLKAKSGKGNHKK